MAEIVNGYLTEGEAISYVGQNLTAPDANKDFLADTVTAASRLIDRYCGRRFYTEGSIGTPEARKFVPPSSGDTLHLGPYNDLQSASSVTFDGVAQASGDYELGPIATGTDEPWQWLRIIGGATWPTVTSSTRSDLITISGVWGWAEVPAEVKAACRLIVAEMVKLRDAPLGIAGGLDSGTVFTRRSLPPRAMDLLAPYRHGLNFGIA